VIGRENVIMCCLVKDIMQRQVSMEQRFNGDQERQTRKTAI